MPAPARTVRQLRLRVPDEAAARRLVPTLEDALRCASLDDEGARLIVVRRLALGRVPAGISSQALSQRMETRVAAIVRSAVPAVGDEAAQADCVVFAGALAARIQLACRLLGGRRCDAWYWPLAVAEFDRGATLRLNIARIALTIARWPEAPAALPRWAAALVGGAGGTGIDSAEALGVAPLASCFDDETGEALLCVAGLTTTSRGSARGPAHTPSGSNDVDSTSGVMSSAGPQVKAGDDGVPAAGGRSGPRHAARAPRWLRRLLELAGASRPAIVPSEQTKANAGTRMTVPVEVSSDDRTRMRITATSDAGLDPDRFRKAEVFMPASDTPSTGQALFTPGAPASADIAKPSPQQVDHPVERPGETPPPLDGRPSTAAAASRAIPDGLLPIPTVCGGLLFLLPILARLGVAQRINDQDQDQDRDRDRDRDRSADSSGSGSGEGDILDQVLHLALCRVRAPADDPMWRLVLPRDGSSTQEPSTSRDAADLLSEARRWLHRAGRLGLVRLVRRPALLRLTATHVDLHFALDRCDLRVRRMGLDLDPGWLPWFGRVVAFHYDRAGEPSP